MARSDFERGFSQTFGPSFQTGSTNAAREAIARITSDPASKLARRKLLGAQLKKAEQDIKTDAAKEVTRLDRAPLVKQKLEEDIRAKKALTNKRLRFTNERKTNPLFLEAAKSAQKNPLYSVSSDDEKKELVLEELDVLETVKEAAGEKTGTKAPGKRFPQFETILDVKKAFQEGKIPQKEALRQTQILVDAGAGTPTP